MNSHSRLKCLLEIVSYSIMICVKKLLQDGTKVFTASTDKQCKMWDLNSNQAIQVAQVKILKVHVITLLLNTSKK